MCSMLFILNVFDKLVPGNVYNKLLYIFIGCFLSSSALSLCLMNFCSETINQDSEIICLVIVCLKYFGRVTGFPQM